MKYVKTFENFEYLIEDVEGTESNKPAGDAPTSEESKEIVNSVAATAKSEINKKSGFTQKLNAKIQKSKSAQKEPEKIQNESFVFESTEGGEILSKENMQKYANSLVGRLPILVAGDKEVKFQGQNVPIPAGAEYEAYKATVFPDALWVNYKDRTGKYQEVKYVYKPSKEEISHLSNIYVEFGKKLAAQQKTSKSLSLGAKILLPVGLVAAIGTMVATGEWHGSGSEPYAEIPTLLMAGAGIAAAGGAAAIASTQISKKIDVAEEAMVMFTSLIKAFCDSMGLSIMEIETIGDIEAILTPDEKVEVPVETTTTAKVESVSNRLKGFNKF